MTRYRYILLACFNVDMCISMFVVAAAESRSCLLQITSRSASKAYLEMVDNSYLGTSDEVCVLRCVDLLLRGFAF